MINIKNFNSNLLKINKNKDKNIDIYHIGYITMKDSHYIAINSVNPVYLIPNEADGSIDEKNGNKYLIFTDTEKKEVLE